MRQHIIRQHGIRHTLAALAIVGLAIVGLAGGTTSAVAQTSTDAPTGFSIVMKDGVISPNSLDVPAGKIFKLEVINKGSATAEFESKRLRIEKVLAPGTRITLTLRNLVPGDYEFVDEFTEDKATAHGVIRAK